MRPKEAETERHPRPLLSFPLLVISRMREDRRRKGGLPQGFNSVFRLVVHLSYLPKRALFFQPITMYENRTVQPTAR
jgi:hypothetical protein